MLYEDVRIAPKRIRVLAAETAKWAVRNKMAAAVTAAVGMVGAASQLDAAVITWGTAQSMVGNTDVANTGTYFDAINFNGSAITVNGVTFNNASGSPASDGIISVEYGDAVGAYGTNFTTFSPSSTAYSNLTRTGAFGAGGSGTVTTGSVADPLIVGHEYQIESWSYYTGDSATATTIYNNGSASSVALLNKTGEYAIGTFTADATTESYTYYTSTGHNFINAVSVFDITPTPEPASISLLALSGIALLRRRRRNGDIVSGNPNNNGTTRRGCVP